jgi:Methyltransferase domain
MQKVLNVGGNSKTTRMPAHYGDWQQLYLDIDPRWKPDVLCDARELDAQGAQQFDAIFCSHNLEHYYAHDVPKVLRGFMHVLHADGFAEVVVPDIRGVMQTVIDNKLDIEDALYQSPAGPISAKDVIYGYGPEIEKSGKDFFAHKTGFTQKSLLSALTHAGFPFVFSQLRYLEIRALAFKQAPTASQRALFGLSLAPATA